MVGSYFISNRMLPGMKMSRFSTTHMRNDIDIDRGSLLQLADQLDIFRLQTTRIDRLVDDVDAIVLKCCDLRDVFVFSRIDFVEEVSEEVVNLLTAESDCQLRWDFYVAHGRSTDLVMAYADRIRLGMSVLYCAESRQWLAVVRYIGPLKHKPKPGIHYGIELDDVEVVAIGAPRNSSRFVPITRLELFEEEKTSVQVKQPEKPNVSNTAGETPLELKPRSGGTAGSSTFYDTQTEYFSNDPDAPISLASSDLSLGDRVYCIVGDKYEPGSVRWLGKLPRESEDVYAGVEFDNPVGTGTGMHTGRNLFRTRHNHASFVPLIGLIKEAEFNPVGGRSTGKSTPTAKFYVPFPASNGSLPPRKPMMNGSLPTTPYFGQKDSGVVTQYVEPLGRAGLEKVIGLGRGIQGYQNSCYLDATLFAMFAFSDSFDRLLLRQSTAEDIPDYNKFLEILATEIIFPLRKLGYVRADHIMKLRRLLSLLLYEVPGLVDAEKDPEEVFTGLFKKVLRADPFISLNSKELQLRDSYFCQLVIEEKLDLSFPSLQQLIESSFFEQDLKFTKVPQNLVVQVPRYGQTRIYPQVFPNLELDLTHLIQHRPRPCAICGQLAAVECSECFLTRSFCSMDDVTYCQDCFNKHHKAGPDGVEHGAKGIVDRQVHRYYDSHPGTAINRTKLSLSAVLCIQSSHYVTFAKSGSADHKPWLFFDSMADRKGEEEGYCIPEISVCPDLQMFLRNENFTQLKTDVDLGSRILPPYLLRLIRDAYVCFYENPMIIN